MTEEFHFYNRFCYNIKCSVCGKSFTEIKYWTSVIDHYNKFYVKRIHNLTLCCDKKEGTK